MSLKDVELTGVVTLFYGEICSKLNLIPSKDEIRSKIYNHYKERFEHANKDVHHLLSIETINFQGIVNVAYRNYKFDQIVKEVLSQKNCSEIINLGCGMDTRFFRLDSFDGNYYDVDFKDVIREKKELIDASDNYHFIETKSIVEKSFWDEELILSSDEPIIIAEGVFCYIEYHKVVKFVKELFERYPKATLICDVFLFDEHQCFDDLKSRLVLKFPVKGEKIYHYISKIPFIKHKKKKAPIDAKKELMGINLVNCENSQNQRVDISYNNKSYAPQFWIGTYRRD